MRTWMTIFALFLSGQVMALTELAGAYGGCASTVTLRTVDATPQNYETAINTALPGDLIRLGNGTYQNGLRLYDLNGSENNCIVIEGPSDQSAVFVGAPINGVRNVVQVRNSSYLVLRNVEIDGTGTTDLDAVKSDINLQGAHPNPWSHHITLENLWIHDFDFDQQQVGISTKGPAWNWVVRQTVIERVGTGIYFGNSDGAQHFVNGLIEFNLIRDTVGYNMQVKHQFAASRPSGTGYESLPATGQTVIRQNVFHKSGNSSSGGAARPNLLVGTFPLSGDGSNDDYLIYGNFFYQNPTGFEALFQGEGNVIFYGNLLFNTQGPAMFIQPQNGEVRRIRVFENTILSSDDGVFISGTVNGAFAQLVRGNAVFTTGTPLAGGTQADNLSDLLINAAQYLVNPDGNIAGSGNRLDLFPLTGTLSGNNVDVSPIAAFVDSDIDFNDQNRTHTILGAYDGEGSNPGWQLALEIKPAGPSDLVFSDGFE